MVETWYNLVKAVKSEMKIPLLSTISNSFEKDKHWEVAFIRRKAVSDLFLCGMNGIDGLMSLT